MASDALRQKYTDELNSTLDLLARSIESTSEGIVSGAMEYVSEIDETSHIERGYENIVEKLQALGADIRRVEIPMGRVTRAI